MKDTQAGGDPRQSKTHAEGKKVGKTLKIYMLILVVLAGASVALADESSRYPFPAKPDAPKPDVVKSQKPVKYPFPERTGVTVGEIDSKGVYLAEEPPDSTRPKRSKTSKKKTGSVNAEKQTSTPAVTDQPAVSSKAAAVTAAPKATSEDMIFLRDHIQRLEEKIQKMEEESEIRKQLESTQEEKQEKEDAILSAAGRDYTLMKPGRLGFEYSFRYSGDSSDSITTSTDNVVSIKHNAYHTLTNSFVIEFPVKDNFTINSNIPFVYKYSSQTSSTAKDTSDLGDVTMGFQFQPVKAGKDLPSFIVSGSLTCPTGRSPYKIDSTQEMATGNGVYSIGLGCNMSKSIDPLVAFGGINVDHGFEVSHLNYKTGTQGESGIYLTGVTPGDIYSLSMGIGYSLSYKATLTLSYQYAYQSESLYDWVGQNDTKSEGSISSVFSVGTGWNLSPTRSVNVRLGIGLTNNDSDFSLQVRIPFTYVL